MESVYRAAAVSDVSGLYVHCNFIFFCTINAALVICHCRFMYNHFLKLILLGQSLINGYAVYLTIEIGRMSDYTIRPKPNSWPSSLSEYRIFGRTSAEWPNFGRILSLIGKILELEITVYLRTTESFFQFYIYEISHLTYLSVGIG